MSENESGFVKEFKEVYDYMHLIGEHVRLIQIRLEKIEKDIDEITSAQGRYISENRSEMTGIKESVVYKNDFSNLKEKLEIGEGGILPPLPKLARESPEPAKTPPQESTDTQLPPVTVEPPKMEVIPPQETKQKEEKLGEAPKRRRFPFLRRQAEKSSQ